MDQGIAVIGLAGKFPNANNVHQLWDILFSGKQTFSPIPQDRWNYTHFLNAAAKANIQPSQFVGSFIETVGNFDAGLFNLSPREATEVSPLQRQLLMVIWQAIEDSGYPIPIFKSQDTGVFVGAAYDDYMDASVRHSLDWDPISQMGNDSPMLSGRISYYFDLHGPSYVINSACASSGIALHQACQSLYLNECATAIVAGAFLMLSPKRFLFHGALGTLSKTGQCLPFAKNADGIVLGESVAAVILKPLSAAIKDNDRIYGVIKGTAINHDGKTREITEPNAIAQENLITRLYNKLNIDSETINYIEAHGTATAVGDPIEIDALKNVFSSTKDKYCAIGSIKSNIGHTTSAAGIVGLIKLIGMLQRKKIPPSFYIKDINPALNLENSPFYIPEQGEPWERRRNNKLIAALNAFGYSGSNFHLILEEFEKNIDHKKNNYITFNLKNYWLPTHEDKALPLNFAEKKTDNFYDNSLTSYLTKIISELLGIPILDIDIEKPFADYGLNSILGTQLINIINNNLNLKLVVTDIYDYPTLYSFRDHIQIIVSPENLENEGNPRKEPLSSILQPQTCSNYFKPQLNHSDFNNKIAVIGISCRFPGSKNAKDYWKNLVHGICSITEIPKDRWNIDDFYDPDLTKPWKMNTKWGGFIEEYNTFDNLFFDIPNNEALYMDPQQRIFLEETWKALEDSGYALTNLSDRKIGVFAAAAHGDYVRRCERANIPPNGHLFIGNNSAILAARISYYLNLTGPTITIDTACSSSLVSTHLACQSILNQECDMAISGGITIFSTEFNFLQYTKSGMLSPEGRCKVFDNKANGFVPGEGVGVIVLKSYKKAMQDQDHIYAVISASGMNQDGRTNGITAPNLISQANLQKEIYQKYSINPETIGYVEAHGTGTKLGDPIEVNALTRSFNAFTQEKQFCYIGSVKTNIGHTIMSAGIAGLIKTILSVNKGIIPPSLFCQVENEHINFKNSPFKIPYQVVNWPDERRKASVNSFGMSGTNVHMVVESPLKSSSSYPLFKNHHNKPLVFLFSAKTKNSLINYIDKFFNDLKEEKIRQNDLINIAYTLKFYRQSMKQRVVIIAYTPQELYSFLEMLPQQLEKFENCKHIFCESKLKQSLQYKKAIDWINGVPVNWDDFYSDILTKISLPTYCFEKNVFWIENKINIEHNEKINLLEPKILSHELIINELQKACTINTDNMDYDDSLINLGLTSLLAIDLKGKLEQFFSINIPIKDFFENLSINGLFQYLSQLTKINFTPDKGKNNIWTHKFSLNVTPQFLRHEAKLPIDIEDKLLNHKTYQNKSFENCFLTGATGFLGVHLLYELLIRTRMKIYCLVRSNTKEESLNRIKMAMNNYNLWDKHFSDRIICIPGSLSETKFNLTDLDYQILVQTIDVILHAGAIVNHVYSYQDLKKVNVTGTIEILNLAATGKIKPVHYLSTIGVCIRRLLSLNDTVVYTDEVMPDNAVGLEVGYSQSKWVAEQILWQAKLKGLPVSIYRGGEITGNYGLSKSRTDDMFHMFLEFFSKISIKPNWPEGIIDIVPVDFVSKAIVTIMHSKADDNIYHLTHSQPVNINKFFEWCSQKNYSFNEVEFDEWFHYCKQYLRDNPNEKNAMLLRQFFVDTPFGKRVAWYFKNYHLSNRHTDTILKNLSIKAPVLNEDLFNHCFNYIITDEKLICV